MIGEFNFARFPNTLFSFSKAESLTVSKLIELEVRLL